MNLVACILTAVSSADLSSWSVGVIPFRIVNASFNLMLDVGMSESFNSDVS